MNAYSEPVDILAHQDRETAVRRFHATAAFHEKMARIFSGNGRKADEASARTAAKLCRESAAQLICGNL